MSDLKSLPIVIPSHKRAGKVMTRKFLPSAMICVPESQLEEYKACDPDAEFLPHPDEVLGLVRKRDWIIKTFSDGVFMVDDDVTSIIDMGATRNENQMMKEPQIIQAIQRTHELCEALGRQVYSFVNAANPLTYQPQTPYKLHGSYRGHCWGFVRGFHKSSLFMNPEIAGADDEWIACLNAHFYRFGLINVRYGFGIKDSHANPGGMASIRTSESKRQEMLTMQRYFGSTVVERVGKEEKGVRATIGYRLQFPF